MITASSNEAMNQSLNINELESFIVSAKSQSYVAGGEFLLPCRTASHDVGYQEGSWSYLDSYFGGTDFIGQEVVWLSGNPVWAMNYFGYILQPEKINAERAGAVIKTALAELYQSGRFLGSFSKQTEYGYYSDESHGSVERFHGKEKILIEGEPVYQLDYHGGLIKD